MNGPPAVALLLADRWAELDALAPADYPDRFVHHSETRDLLARWIAGQIEDAPIICGLAPDDPRHGTVTGYNNHGCRCVHCLKAGRADSRDRARRLRARRREAPRSVTSPCPQANHPGR